MSKNENRLHVYENPLLHDQVAGTPSVCVIFEPGEWDRWHIDQRGGLVIMLIDLEGRERQVYYVAFGMYAKIQEVLSGKDDEDWPATPQDEVDSPDNIDMVAAALDQNNDRQISLAGVPAAPAIAPPPWQAPEVEARDDFFGNAAYQRAQPMTDENSNPIVGLGGTTYITVGDDTAARKVEPVHPPVLAVMPIQPIVTHVEPVPQDVTYSG